MSEAICSVGDCDKSVVCRGLCPAHYARLKRYGDPLGAPRRPSPEERFWVKVDKNGTVPVCRPDLPPCWEWLAVRVDGYGQFNPHVGKQVRAHRYAYEQLVGPIPPGLEPDHLCRNRGCVFPGHMELVTAAENRRRGDTSRPNNRGLPGHRTLNGEKTHCKRGHEFTEENTYRWQRPGGKVERQCRTCMREADRRHKERRRLG